MTVVWEMRGREQCSGYCNILYKDSQVTNGGGKDMAWIIYTNMCVDKYQRSSTDTHQDFKFK